METVNVRIDVLKRVNSLSEDDVHSYPYATGYSRSAMQYAIEDLNNILNK
jgi:hypothetical protein